VRRGPRAQRTGRAENMTRRGQRNDKAPRVKVTLVRSPIGYDRRHGLVVKGLGLRRLGHSVEVVDNPSVRGMIHKVRHLVRVG